MSGMSRPGSTSTGEAGADGTRPVPRTPDPSLALPNSLGTRRTGDGHPKTVPRHPPGTMEKMAEDLRIASERAGTRPVPRTPDPSLALMTFLGTRRMGDGHPTTVPRHPTGMIEEREDPRASLEGVCTTSPQEPLPGPSCFAWPEFPDEDWHPPRPPASLPGEQGGFQDGCPSWDYRGLGGKRYRRLRRSHRELTLVQRVPRPWPTRGHPPSSRSSPSLCWPKIKEEPQHPDPSQPLPSFKDGAQSRKQMAQDPPAVSRKIPEPPSPASTPQRSPATDPQVATEAPEPEQAAGATPVEPGARQEPAGSNGQGPSASETELALPEQSSAGTSEHLEVEPCSQSVPKAGADAGSPPHGPTAPSEPAERVRVAASSAGEVDAELCPRSQGQQHLPSGAGEAESEAAHDGLLGGHQPSENSQVPSGATAEPDTQPSQACSDICATPETSLRTQHPPGSVKTEPAAGSRCQLCSALLTSSPAGADLRSAAVLARKEEIELSYQQFSLTIAVVATMLLQKEPSMEPALGLALRANLRQGRIHHLQELEDFINSYDSATLSR
ncbi:trithorax group protein osa-like isoform X2 [Egretta garzetta]|uniref:trithorax group protein osa-like isoform X2 n=1 Tax=Egretta garzetta TaxID=188379 RepID=UPI00163C296B|nr:trithorax group protein osa-like isoform X2 [Egretta garzetta]